MERIKISHVKGINDQGKRIERRTRTIIIAVILFCIVGIPIILSIIFSHYLKNVYGGFDSPEAVAMFYNEIQEENIVDVIYGGDSACVFFINEAGEESVKFVYRHNDKWLLVNAKSQTTTYSLGGANYSINISYLASVDDYYVKVFVLDWENEIKSLRIDDCYNSDFVKIQLSTKHALDYISYFKPTKKEYSITIEGNEYNIELKYYK